MSISSVGSRLAKIATTHGTEETVTGDARNTLLAVQKAGNWRLFVGQEQGECSCRWMDGEGNKA